MADCQGPCEEEVLGDMAADGPGPEQAGQQSESVSAEGGGMEGEGGCPRDKLEEEVPLWEEEEEDTSDTTGDEEEEVDPRVAENLEIMNHSCAEVNRLENELDEARSKYRSTFQTSSQRMEAVGAKIRKSIQRARLYFDLSDKYKQAQDEAVRAAWQYKTANSTYRAAIEMVTLAEEGLLNAGTSKTRTLTSEWQETMGYAMEKVTNAEREKSRSELEYNQKAAICAEIEAQLHLQEKKYKRSIAKARPYFETKAELELKLQQLKQNVWDLQQTISRKKASYSEALHKLEDLSTEIHESRRSRKKMLLQFPREPGVGAETDSVGSSISEANIERGIFSSTASYPDEDEDESDEVGELPSPVQSDRGVGTSVSSQASDRVFSRSISSTSVFSEGHSDSASESPGSAPAVTSVPHSPLAQRASTSPSNPPPSRLMDLARGDLAPREGQGASASPGERGSGGGLTAAVPQEAQTVQNSEFPFADCPREAGDGSAQEDCPGEESSSPLHPDSQTSLCSRFSSALPPHHGGGPQSLEPPLKAAESPGVETGQRSGSTQGEVQKAPLRRTDVPAHRPLQGVMLLNPSDLPASPFHLGPRR